MFSFDDKGVKESLWECLILIGNIALENDSESQPCVHLIRKFEGTFLPGQSLAGFMSNIDMLRREENLYNGKKTPQRKLAYDSLSMIERNGSNLKLYERALRYHNQILILSF